MSRNVEGTIVMTKTDKAMSSAERVRSMKNGVFRVTKIGELGTTQAATSNRRTLRTSQRTSVASSSC
jgi:hypothetical protein